MGNKKTVMAVAFLAVALAAAAPAAAQGLKIGVFDPQRVSEESAQGKRLQAQLTALQQTKQAELRTKQQGIEDLERAFTEQSLSLSAERRKDLQLEIERRKLDAQNAKNLAQQELQLEFAGAQNQFNEMLVRGVAEFGRNEQFDLILDMAAVAWAAESIDVTTAIIDRLDAMYPVAEANAGEGKAGQ